MRFFTKNELKEKTTEEIIGELSKLYYLVSEISILIPYCIYPLKNEERFLYKNIHVANNNLDLFYIDNIENNLYFFFAYENIIRDLLI
jgi:hypothetical protein